MPISGRAKLLLSSILRPQTEGSRRLQLRDAAILTTEPTEVTGGVSVERLACRFVLVLALVIVIVDSLIR